MVLAVPFSGWHGVGMECGFLIDTSFVRVYHVSSLSQKILIATLSTLNAGNPLVSYPNYKSIEDVDAISHFFR